LGFGVFGYRIGKCIISESDDYDIKQNLKLNIHNYRLVYFFVPPSYININRSISELGAFLYDEKIIYINTKFKVPEIYPDSITEIKKIDDSIIRLALLSGEFSRFKLDNGFKKNEFEKLYKEWIYRSVNHEIADEVLAYRISDLATGIITLKHDQKVTHIGLIAVDEKNRGKNIGSKLLQASYISCQKKDHSKIEVATQKRNRGACNFYEKNGFQIKEILNVYHLWL
jgi:dTDP-4-amino-4,6-dideoxy-D-galactose acyltransferase